MNGTLAQLIALTAYGNDYLRHGELSRSFNTENSTFQYCNTIDFREVKKRFFFTKAKEEVIATTPGEWFTYLKNDGCTKLRLYFEHSKDQSLVKDHMLAGFVGGGGVWLIEAMYDTYSNYWANRWEVTRKNAADNKIWSVNYVLAGKKLATINKQPDSHEAKDNLRETLIRIEDFAFRHNLQYWGEQFQNAKRNLESNTPAEVYYHKDMVPTGNYTLIAQQLMFAAGAAWVFGGMGSWNDMGFDDNQSNDLHQQLTAELYDNVIDAFISAVNSF